MEIMAISRVEITTEVSLKMYLCRERISESHGWWEEVAGTTDFKNLLLEHR